MGDAEAVVAGADGGVGDGPEAEQRDDLPHVLRTGPLLVAARRGVGL